MPTIITISSADIEVLTYALKPPIAVPYVREPRLSAADIDVPAVAVATDKDRVRNDGLRSLHHGLVQAGVSNNDQILTLIDACIDAGLNSRMQIKVALEELGYKAGNVVPKLNYETGTASHCRYERDDQGTYSLKEPTV